MSKQNSNTINTVIGTGLYETVDRFGSATAEFLKGLRGVDNETGRNFDRSLRKVAGYDINSDFIEAKKNISQQAGWAAEVVKTSRDNSEHIINRTSTRVSRTEDVPGYGKNHTQFDHVEMVDGQVTPGTHSQMKFVSDLNDLLRKIAGGSGGGKKDLSRYMEVDWLDLPSEQVEEAKRICQNKAASLRKEADHLAAEGNNELATQRWATADNYEALEEKIRDAGITRDKARDYRMDPEWETTKDIGRVSHRAGLEGAKFGAAIGGSIALVTNIIALHSGDKELAEAAGDVALTTVQSAGIGYATAFAGTAIKGFMQQSVSAYTRSLASTSLPTLAVSVSLAMGKSVKRYAMGEISETVLLEEVGGTAYGMMSSTVFSAVGQVVIPIPVVGAMVGGIVGYTLSNLFYESFLQALHEEKAAHAQYLFIKEKCEAARAITKAYKVELEEILSRKIEEFGLSACQLSELFTQTNEVSSDRFAYAINAFAEQLGHNLRFKSQQEFDAFMASDEPLII